MNTVQHFNRGMLKSYLKSNGLHYLRDQDNDFVINFSGDDEIGCDLAVWLITSSNNADVLDIMIEGQKPIPKAQWGQALTVCNEWNKSTRWPKAFLQVNDPSKDTVGKILLKEAIDLEKGVHQELLDDYIDTSVSASIQFWMSVNKEHKV